MDVSPEAQAEAAERESVAVDIACVGFGPAMGGFLTTLSRALADGSLQSSAGLPPQVICYERADDLGVGVSGVVTRSPAANVKPICGFTWIWLIPSIWYSTGSSMVMIFLSGRLMRFSAE